MPSVLAQRVLLGLAGSCSFAEAYNAHAARGSPTRTRHPTRIAFKVRESDILRQGTFIPHILSNSQELNSHDPRSLRSPPTSR